MILHMQFNIIYIRSARDMVSMIFVGTCYGSFRSEVN